jgi:DNA adenine methylase
MPNKSIYRYAGGKHTLAPFIIDLIPKHTVYVEPYFGAGSVFFQKDKSEIEVINDLHSELITFWRCLQNKKTFDELQHRLTYTLYSREEYYLANKILHSNNKKYSDIEKAWAFFVCAQQSFGGSLRKKGGWGYSREKMPPVPETFASKVRSLPEYAERMRGVYIENNDALSVINTWDSVDTFFYLDPPYVHTTRKAAKIYIHEQSDDHHTQLIELLLTIKGKCILSGYASDIYLPLEHNGWQRKNIAFHSNLPNSTTRRDTKNKQPERIETIWCNYHPNSSLLFEDIYHKEQ